MAELDRHKSNPLLGGLARDASRLMEDLQHSTGGLGLRLEQGSASRERRKRDRLEERMEEVQRQLAWLNFRAPGHKSRHAGSYWERQAWDNAFDMCVCMSLSTGGEDCMLAAGTCSHTTAIFS
jgi:hypothetical protein